MQRRENEFTLMRPFSHKTNGDFVTSSRLDGSLVCYVWPPTAVRYSRCHRGCTSFCVVYSGRRPVNQNGIFRYVWPHRGSKVVDHTLIWTVGRLIGLLCMATHRGAPCGPLLTLPSRMHFILCSVFWPTTMERPAVH